MSSCTVAMCCFIEGSLSMYRPGSRTVEAGWILLQPIWTEQSSLFSFDYDPNHIASVLSAFSSAADDVTVSA